MQISLPPEIEAIAQSAVQRGDYESIADFISAVVRSAEMLPTKPETFGQVPAYKLPYEQWKTKFDEFLSKQVTTNLNFDDRRESIYPDRT